MVSPQFNKFAHGVVLPQLKACKVLKFDTPCFKFRPQILSFDSFKQLLKALDFDYPIDEKGAKLSYTKLTDKQLCEHINWMELIASNNDFTLDYINAEWQRLIQNIR